MFSYFHQHKFLNNNKGQMLPIFILVLAVIIIMAMVTINIGKIGFIKTDSSNAADAGALAAGATMSNTFNSIAVANSQMEAGYWEFFAEMSTMFAAASVLALVAQSTAIAAQGTAGLAQTSAGDAAGAGAMALLTAIVPTGVCDAIETATEASTAMGAAQGSMDAAVASMGTAVGSITGVISILIGMMVSVTAFTTAQNFFYLSIRKMAEEGRKNAIRTGHQYLFNNSGITGKLKRNIFKEFDIQNWQQLSNYQQAFAIFMKFIVKDACSYVYGWIDGQNRAHSVTSNININPVDKFKLKVSTMPYPAEMALLGVALAKAFATEGQMSGALGSYSAAAAAYAASLKEYGTAVKELTESCAQMELCFDLVIPACAKWIKAWAKALKALGKGLASNLKGMGANAAGLATNAAALATLPALYITLFAGGGSALAGLLPGPSIVAFGDAMGIMFIICWIDDIIHDRLVRASTTQTHGAGNLTLWNTQYPVIESYSIVNFNDENKGSIHPPVPRHDSSITWTDIYLPEMNPQNDFCSEVQGKVQALEEELQSLQDSSNSLEDNATLIQGQADNERNDTGDLINEYDNLAGGLRSDAGDYQNRSTELENQIEDASERIESIPSLFDFIKEILQAIMDILQDIIGGFSGGIGFLSGGADLLGSIGQTMGNRVGNQTDTMDNTADQISTHVHGQQQDEINRIQQDIDNYRQTYPQCFVQ